MNNVNKKILPPNPSLTKKEAFLVGETEYSFLRKDDEEGICWGSLFSCKSLVILDTDPN